MKMLMICLIQVLFTFAAQAKSDPQIIVTCPCHYSVDSLIETAMVSGVRKNPSEIEVQACQFSNSRVSDSCFAAIMNAQMNCQRLAEMRSNDLEARGASVDSYRCFGTYLP